MSVVKKNIHTGEPIEAFFASPETAEFKIQGLLPNAPEDLTTRPIKEGMIVECLFNCQKIIAKAGKARRALTTAKHGSLEIDVFSVYKLEWNWIKRPRESLLIKNDNEKIPVYFTPSKAKYLKLKTWWYYFFWF